MDNSSCLWGVDLGGTKIEAVVLKSAGSPEVLLRKRIPTQANKGYTHVLGRIQHLIQLMVKELGFEPTKIGFGTPGSTDPESGLLKNSNSIHLNHQPLQKDLQELLKIPVFLANDANCFAVAETNMGIVKKSFPDAKVVFGVIMGSGVGGGLVVNGKVWNGRHGIAGEWGHNFLDHSGGDCYCGQNGCVETILSGPSLQRYYEKVSGKEKTLQEITEAAPEDVHAQQTMERLIHFFGKGISTIVNSIDPDVIIIGGGVGNISQLYKAGVIAVEKFTFNPTLKTPIIPPQLGDSAGVFGAAFLTV